MNKIRMLSFLLGLLFLTSTVAMAQYPVIDSEQLKSHLTGKKKVVLIDSRTPEEYQQAHIPGAIIIPADQMKMDAAKLPRDKATPLIFYCRGLGCTLSRMAASSAVEMGYTSIMIYQPGMPDWLLKGYPVQKGKHLGKLK
jgi:rhodanese-related sulfurtransferase